jgi:hypothetical protein
MDSTMDLGGNWSAKSTWILYSSLFVSVQELLLPLNWRVTQRVLQYAGEVISLRSLRRFFSFLEIQTVFKQ